jgi:hypothetical protein
LNDGQKNLGRKMLFFLLSPPSLSCSLTSFFLFLLLLVAGGYFALPRLASLISASYAPFFKVWESLEKPREVWESLVQNTCFPRLLQTSRDLISRRHSMYKFSGWMMRNGTPFDAATIQEWNGVSVRTRKYFLGLPEGSTGQVLGVVECAANQFLLLVEWEHIEQATRRLDCFSREAAESYLLRMTDCDREMGR